MWNVTAVMYYMPASARYGDTCDQCGKDIIIKRKYFIFKHYFCPSCDIDRLKGFRRFLRDKQDENTEI